MAKSSAKTPQTPTGVNTLPPGKYTIEVLRDGRNALAHQVGAPTSKPLITKILESTTAPLRNFLGKRYFRVYGITGWITATIGLFITWYFAATEWGFLLGVTFGWMPGAIVGAVLGLFWPIAAIGVWGLLVWNFPGITLAMTSLLVGAMSGWFWHVFLVIVWVAFVPRFSAYWTALIILLIILTKIVRPNHQVEVERVEKQTIWNRDLLAWLNGNGDKWWNRK